MQKLNSIINYILSFCFCLLLFYCFKPTAKNKQKQYINIQKHKIIKIFNKDIQNSLLNIDFKYYNINNDLGGYYNKEKNYIKLNLQHYYNDDFKYTISHELFHALDYYSIPNYSTQHDISDLFIIDIDRYKSNLLIINTLFIKNNCIKFTEFNNLYFNWTINHFEYLTTNDELFARLLNFKYYLFDNNYIDNINDDLTYEIIDNVFHDFILSKQLNDFYLFYLFDYKIIYTQRKFIYQINNLDEINNYIKKAINI